MSDYTSKINSAEGSVILTIVAVIILTGCQLCQSCVTIVVNMLQCSIISVSISKAYW